MIASGSRITLGTRASPLALIQAGLVTRALKEARPDIDVSLLHISTSGDETLDRPIADLGERAVFVTAIEDALRSGEIDFAVHSGKDLPSRLPSDMTIAAWLPRADPRDALVSLRRRAPGPPARIGTSAPRRTCQVRSMWPSATVSDVRGNVGTRLDKLRRGEYDALVLAMAGLDRLGVGADLSLCIEPLTTDEMLPAAAQGALAVETRADRTDITELLMPLGHRSTTIAVSAERALLTAVGGGCHAVVAAYAQVSGDEVNLQAMIGAADGRHRRAAESGPSSLAAEIGAQLGGLLLRDGGAELLATPAR